jgi:dipeptidyl aminopeptidase/acylaminoacyl peptidase
MPEAKLSSQPLASPSTSPTGTASNHLIPVRDFFRNPEKAGYAISPNGEYISLLQPFERRLNIFVASRDSVVQNDASPARVTGVTERDIRQYLWKGNDFLLYLLDFGGDENFHLYAVDRQGKSTRDLTPFEGVCVQVVDQLDQSDTELIIAMNKRDPELFDVYRLNVASGELTLISQNPGNVIKWVTDHDGKLRAASVSDGVNATLLYRDTEAEEFREIITTNFKEQLNPLFFTFDNKNIYASSNLGRDKSALIVFDPRSKKEIELIFEHPEVDVDGLDYSKKRKVLTEIDYVTWKAERKILDGEMAAVYTELERQLPGVEILLTAHDRAEKHFIVRTYSDKSLGAIYYYESDRKSLVKLADMSPWLPAEDLVEMKPITYQSRDGLTIHGYLSLPKGNVPKNLPIVVNPHGGPWHRDMWGYNPEVQFLTNRGYGVLQMNFRGSTGYGRKFWEASFKQWGKTMQDDITDGVNWLIQQGIADPKRVAIYGGSYGGYATLAGVTFTPDLYCCAIDYVGVSNLFTFQATIPPYWKPIAEMMYEMVGNPETEKELLRAASPVFHVDRIKAPLMVLQGAKDPRVNVEESNQIVEALRSRGIDVPYIVKENEGHGFRNEENRFEAYEAMEAFLAKHLN